MISRVPAAVRAAPDAITAPLIINLTPVLQALMAAGCMRACACRPRRQVRPARIHCHEIVTFSQGIRFVGRRMTV